VTVVVSRDSSSTKTLEGPADDSRASTRSILVVDDDTDIRSTLCEYLEDEGYAVGSAANGKDALDYLREHPTTSVVLLDLMMPIMDGYQFRIEQKSDPAIASIPVVVMTARGAIDRTEIDVDQVLAKPLELTKLRAALDRAAPATPSRS
jgi:CheY-like chemotaxis protein